MMPLIATPLFAAGPLQFAIETAPPEAKITLVNSTAETTGDGRARLPGRHPESENMADQRHAIVSVPTTVCNNSCVSVLTRLGASS
jgi:hypothetical protein